MESALENVKSVQEQYDTLKAYVLTVSKAVLRKCSAFLACPFLGIVSRGKTNILISVGEDNPSLEESDMTKLEAVMDVIRDTHAGSCWIIERLMGQLSYPSFQEE